MTALLEKSAQVDLLDRELQVLEGLDEAIVISLIHQCLALNSADRERLLRRHVPWLLLKELSSKDQVIAAYVKRFEDWEYEFQRARVGTRAELQELDVFDMLK